MLPVNLRVVTGRDVGQESGRLGSQSGARARSSHVHTLKIFVLRPVGVGLFPPCLGLHVPAHISLSTPTSATLEIVM